MRLSAKKYLILGQTTLKISLKPEFDSAKLKSIILKMLKF